MSARARRSLLLEIRMETIVNTCTNRRCKLKGCGSFNEYGSEGPAQAQLGGKTFVPLPNFMPGGDRFKNTCFIAAVVNLSSVFPAIGQALRLEQNSWGDVIRLARSLDNNKNAYAQQHGGQHDAAELLGDCLWHDGTVGIDIIRRTTAVDCNHEWTTSVRNMMLVLELPLDDYGPRCHSMEELLQYTFEDYAVSDLECPVCGMKDQQGWVHREFETPLPGVIALRINRYAANGSRRNHLVRPGLSS